MGVYGSDPYGAYGSSDFGGGRDSLEWNTGAIHAGREVSSKTDTSSTMRYSSGSENNFEIRCSENHGVFVCFVPCRELITRTILLGAIVRRLMVLS